MIECVAMCMQLAEEMLLAVEYGSHQDTRRHAKRGPLGGIFNGSADENLNGGQSKLRYP
jgi:hypothetical protein